MFKTTIAAWFAAVLLAFTPVVQAQTTHHSGASATANDMNAGEFRASKFMGSAVYDVNNQKIGSVKDLLFDQNGRIEKAVVDVGTFLGMGGKLVAVNLSDIKIDNNRLTLDMTKDQLKAAQDFRHDENANSGSSMPPQQRSMHHAHKAR
jgi:sporulation protein YlmC with PRC-barrel domain